MRHVAPKVTVVGALFFAAQLARAPAAEKEKFKSHRLTKPGEYTDKIEGPAVDAAGNLYVVNFGVNGTIGKVPAGAAVSQKFLELPLGSIGSRIRIAVDQRMFIADFAKHNIFVVEAGRARVYFHSDQFSQPNDLTVAADGTIYASDPRRHHAGHVWRIVPGPDGKGVGQPMESSRTMGVVNRIDLSPDEKTLYVSESKPRNASGMVTPEIWAYRIDGAKLTDHRLVKKFPDFDVDGLRTDIDGRISVARIEKGSVLVVSPDGQVVKEITTVGKNPNNPAFGGSDGMTFFVMQVDDGLIETFRVARPGREFCL
jgi:sugar lactone lactonase YvrE